MASLFIVKSLAVFFQLLLLVSGSAHYEQCPSSFMCGDLGPIKFPFTVSQHPHCGVLAIHGCHDPNANKSIQISNAPTGRFQVQIVENIVITITDETLGTYLRSNNCDAFSHNLTLPPSSPLGTLYLKYNTSLFRCNKSLNVTLPQHYYSYTRCPAYNIYYALQDFGSPQHPSYHGPTPFPAACSKLRFGIRDSLNTDNPFAFLSNEILIEVQLSDDCTKCVDHERGNCQLDGEGKFQCVAGIQRQLSRNSIPGGRSWVKMGLGVILGATVILVLVMVTLYYTRSRKRNPTRVLVGAFLERHGHLQIKRYSYAEIKKMTNSFKNKLGQGGFGCVYKGQLQDGRHVAVKLLNELKGDGEEFINEVASMSRTSHVNIVALLGFCFESSKRALVYEFMPNGSLEKYIYEENDMTMDRQLDCQTLYDIAIGVTRGLEYLHKGCNTRILHFDIKPHNILLDENLYPKISDFGLAKVCTRKESMVSIFGARGTAGYIAPEVFSRNFGAVSHKSDVYSYGMMVLEMVGRRKNIKADIDASSEIYFPHWIYNHLLSSQELSLRSIKNESDNEKVRKMIVVSLWCIQTNPSTRPSITKVVEMLEGRVELLQLPPKPFWFSPATSPDHLSCEM